MKYIINIQSISDIITNSSSEIFTVDNSNNIIKTIEELFKTYDSSDKWNYAGEFCGCQIWTIKDEYNGIIDYIYDYEIEIENFHHNWKHFNFDKIMEKFLDKIECNKVSQYINIKNLNFEEYIEFMSFYLDHIITLQTIFVQMDYGNQEFIKELENLGIILVNYD